MSSTATARHPWLDPPQWAAAAAARCFQALTASPSWLYFATLTAMLFRPPDLSFYHLDRIAFLFLIFLVILRVLVLGQSLRLGGPVTWPMLGLLMLAACDVLSQPYASEQWAALVTRWVVPLGFFHLAQVVFHNDEKRERAETFSLIILAYLAIIAVFFLLGLHSLIFPKFVLDENLGIHADRARGPFLQAVANGVILNLLGLVALNAFRRGRLRGGIAFLLLASLPIAILATKTRAVWLSFALSILAIPLVSHSRRLRQACLAISVVSALTVVVVMSSSDPRAAIADRLADESPLDFRVSVYQAGWQMFLEKPALGWNSSDIQPELLKRVPDFHSDGFAFHNSYLDIAVSQGGLGLLLYLWLYVDLLRLGWSVAYAKSTNFVDTGFRKLWPVMVGVYALNACFVLMQYQFVNALLFSFAGMLAAQNRPSLTWRSQ